MKKYRSEKSGRTVLETYDRLLASWQCEKKERDVETEYGTTHVIECGTESAPPLVLFHGVGDDSALMWICNAPELGKHFRLYAVDTIGGPGKSVPNGNYGKGFDNVRWIDGVLDALGEPALAALLADSAQLPAEAIAARVLEAAERAGGPGDDKTALCLKLGRESAGRIGRETPRRGRRRGLCSSF